MEASPVPSRQVGGEPQLSVSVGVYSPYFGSVYGGGEKYLACTACALRDALPSGDIELLAPVRPDPEQCRRILGVDLDGIRLRSTNPQVGPIHRALNRVTALRPLRDRFLGWQAARRGSAYDVFIPMVYAIPVQPSGRRNAMLCQFPYRNPRASVRQYNLVICQSEYVRAWVRNYWDLDSAVVNPPIDVPSEEPDWAAKTGLILSVGRFFSGGHSKRQEVLIDAFRDLVDGGLEGWELHLAGSVHRDAHHAGYFESVAKRARGYPVVLHPDAPRSELMALYRIASIYWHAAGYEVDPNREPERLEHFGMSTAEAMAHGAVPVVFAAGGQLEVVKDGQDGLHWRTTLELASHTRTLIEQPSARERLGGAARDASHRWSRTAFASNIVAALRPVLS